jgi:hypothetical protein
MLKVNIHKLSKLASCAGKYPLVKLLASPEDKSSLL